jgi:hypothetical protein
VMGFKRDYSKHRWVKQARPNRRAGNRGGRSLAES